MSWHCAFCGGSEGCNGLIQVVDIRGGIPVTLCCHISCFAKKLPSDVEAKQRILDWDKELKEENNGQ